MLIGCSFISGISDQKSAVVSRDDDDDVDNNNNNNNNANFKRPLWGKAFCTGKSR